MKLTRHFTCMLLLFTPVLSWAQWLGFEIRQTLETDKRMYALTLAHTDNDEFPDLITLPADPFNAVQLYSNNSEGNFSYTSTLLKDENYRTMIVGDIDNDGIDDLVISGYWLNGFKIFWGNPGGTYLEGAHYGLTGHGKNVKLTDLNLDGALDIVALSGGSGQPITLHLFYGNKSRVLTPSGIYSSVLHTDMRIAIADKDGNGLPDIIVASSFPWFVIFYQQRNGTFVPRYWPYQLEDLFTSQYHFADLNNDMKVDIIANYMQDELRFYAGQPDTLFSENYTSFKTDISPYRLFFADLNKDGSTDMVMDNQRDEYEFTDRIYYMLGNGDFTFQAPQWIQLPGIVQNLLVNDFNNDGFPDIIASCEGKGIVTILNAGFVTGVGEGELSPASAFPNPFQDHLQLTASSPATVSVYDSRGMLTEKIVIDEKKALDTSSWQKGLYIFKVETKEKYITKRLMKK